MCITAAAAFSKEPTWPQAVRMRPTQVFMVSSSLQRVEGRAQVARHDVPLLLKAFETLQFMPC